MLVRKVSKDLASAEARRNWLAYWQHFSRESQVFCAEIHCLIPSSQAVLVKHDKNEDDVFVIPLCQCHSNNLEGMLEIGDTTEVIPFHYTL
ncbi:hypothetical protein EXA18_07620 [Vibrio cincinnatiensis]|uniref:Uncharacterized protein n=1 Tax=Vibrio cincinnatiensis DSM 19608 TaxID=1123491 RepID=A0A1T4RF92_VIBCI|nr:hypothetical protein [Vibrio cincinnatiensis]MCG3743350.1 hypothetical protein [Vibrio cincinnatiensis]SKA14672.1 hypothetical protein SAMN02745782_02610 [Vibrio cincinnatiensis DSM 19608]SUP50132.1 Uncharacterised protein [Vibrio cincinnatiensis]